MHSWHTLGHILIPRSGWVSRSFAREAFRPPRREAAVAHRHPIASVAGRPSRGSRIQGRTSGVRVRGKPSWASAKKMRSGGSVITGFRERRRGACPLKKICHVQQCRRDQAPMASSATCSGGVRRHASGAAASSAARGRRMMNVVPAPSSLSSPSSPPICSTSAAGDRQPQAHAGLVRRPLAAVVRLEDGRLLRRGDAGARVRHAHLAPASRSRPPW